MTILSIRDPAELTSYLESREPASTEMLAPIVRRGMGRRTNQAWWVSSATGSRVGCIVVEHVGPTVWRGHLILDGLALEDPALAPVVGAFFQRSRASAVWGPATSVDPILAHLPRASTPPRRFWLLAAQATPELVDNHFDTWGISSALAVEVRPATLADLEPLCAIYAEYELSAGAGMRSIRRVLKSNIRDNRVAVAIIDDQIAGASALGRMTRQYAVQTSLTVPPEFRGRGLGSAIGAWQALQQARAGRGVCGKRVDTNGSREQFESGPGFHTEVVVSASLDLRLRDRVLRRLLRYLSRFDGKPATPRPGSRPRYAQLPDES